MTLWRTICFKKHNSQLHGGSHPTKVEHINTLNQPHQEDTYRQTTTSWGTFPRKAEFMTFLACLLL